MSDNVVPNSNSQPKRTKRSGKAVYARIILSVAGVFAVVACGLLILSICFLPRAVAAQQQVADLYANGVEVDASFKGYYDDYGLKSRPSDPYRRIFYGRFHLIYEYVDDNGRIYTDEYLDPVKCETRTELSAREQEIQQIVVTDGKTKKMLIADSGLCCLSVYRETLKRPSTVILYAILIPVSAVVLALCIFGIVRQSKTLRRLSKSKI